MCRYIPVLVLSDCSRKRGIFVNYRYVYENFFKAMDWHQVGAISEGGQEFPEYHLLVQEHLQQSGISVVVKRKLVRNYSLNELDVSQIFADLRAQNVRVIIADFFVFAARAVMCEAWRQVQGL